MGTHHPIPGPKQEALFAIDQASGAIITPTQPAVEAVPTPVSPHQEALPIGGVILGHEVQPHQPVLPVKVPAPQSTKPPKPFGGRPLKDLTHDSDVDEHWQRRQRTPEEEAASAASLGSKDHADLAARVRRSTMRLIAKESHGNPHIFAAKVRLYDQTHPQPDKNSETA